MTGNERFDDSIGRWLQETAPDRLPARVLAATFERTHRTRQDGAWRPVLRRRPMPRLVPALGTAAALVLATVLAINVGFISEPGGTPTPSLPAATASLRPTAQPSSTPPPTAPPVDAKDAALLSGFLEARIAGEGAEQYFDSAEGTIPLLYATTAGGLYERAEFEPVVGYEWPYGWTAFVVRLFAGDTVVEQLVFTTPADPALIAYQGDGFQGSIAPTTEDGEPIAVPSSEFDGQVTVRLAHPWVGHFDGARLIPEGAGPTTDGGQRNGWDVLVLAADPAPVPRGCQAGAPLADAAALAESIRSDPGILTTSPVVVSVGAGSALVMDVTLAEDVDVCRRGITGRTPDDPGQLVLENIRVVPGERMRLYLFDAPAGLSMRVLVIAISVSEAGFERAATAVAPVVESLEFHVP